MPTLNKARETARKASCVSILKQYGNACILYANGFDDYWLPAQPPDWPWNLAWRNMLDAPGENPYNPGGPVGDERTLPALVCPSAFFALQDVKNGKVPMTKSYGLNMGNYYAGDRVRAAKLSRVREPSRAVSHADSLGWNLTGEAAGDTLSHLAQTAETVNGWQTIMAYRHNSGFAANGVFYDGHGQTCDRETMVNRVVWKNFY